MAEQQVEYGGWSRTAQGDQILPLNVFDTFHDLVVSAPMPGVEPGDIEVTVSGSTLTIRAELRGPGQERRQYVRREWSYGPYFRRFELPSKVDAEHANASFGNGILTLTLPKAQTAQVWRIELRETGAAQGHHQGHSGHHTEIDVHHRR